MENSEVKANARRRVVVIFDNEAEYREVEDYAKSKFLDVKAFLKFATKSYIDKYPRNTGKPGRDVQPYA